MPPGRSVPRRRVRAARRARRRRVAHNWAVDLALAGAACAVVGVFLAATVNKFDADELKELGVMLVSVVGALKAIGLVDVLRNRYSA